MPTGTFYGDGGITQRDQSLTGTGAPSQPNTLSGPAPLGGQTMAMGSQTTPNYGYGAQPPTQQLNPNIGKWAMDAARTSMSNQLAQQAVGPASTNLSGPHSLLESYYGPQNAIIGNQLARQYAGLGEVGVRADYNAGLLNRDTDLARAGLALDKKGVGLDRAALGVDTGLTNAQLGNLGRLKAILGKQYGLEGENFDTQLSQLGIDEAKLKDMAKRQVFDLRSNLTARGAFNTEANKRGTGRIDRDLIYGLGGIANQRRSADIAHRGNVLGLDEKGIGLDNQGLNLRARLANNGIDADRLNLALDRIGLSEQEVTNRLTDGLANIGFDSRDAINGFLDSMQGILVGVSADQATRMVQDLAGLVNLPPDILAAMLGVQYTATPTAPSGSADPTRNL